MSWINKILYVRSVWFAIAGLLIMSMGLSKFEQTPKQLRDLQTTEGIVDSAKYQTLVSMLSDGKSLELYCYIIFFANGESAYLNYDLDKIESTQIKKGDICTVWIERSEAGEQRNYIRALAVNGETVIQFKNTHWSLYIAAFGFLLFSISLYVVIKGWAIAFRKSNKKNAGREN